MRTRRSLRGRVVTTLATGVLALLGVAASAAELCGEFVETVDVDGGLETHVFTDGDGDPASAVLTLLTVSPSIQVDYYDGGWQSMPTTGSVSGTRVRFTDGSSTRIHADFGACEVDIQDVDE